MWANGRELAVPKGATKEYRCRGTYGGQSGAWLSVTKNGRILGTAFAPGLCAPQKGTQLQIIRDIEPFQNVAVDNGYIGGRKQRRDMMRAHNLVEVGNERPTTHPRDRANPNHAREVVESLKKNSGGRWL